MFCFAGGALSRSVPGAQGARTDLVRVPPPTLGHDLGQLLAGGQGTDFEFVVEGQTFKAHKIILQVRAVLCKQSIFGRRCESMHTAC
jgi:hypothetical protein